MNSIHKFVLPISILLGCVILGGFYYATEANKQVSIERQQQQKIQQAETQRNLLNDCLAAAQDDVKSFIQKNCTPDGINYDCADGVVAPYKKQVNDECFKKYN